MDKFLKDFDLIELLQEASEKETFLMSLSGDFEKGFVMRLYEEGDLKNCTKMPIETFLGMVGIQSPEALGVVQSIMEESDLSR